jgi:hypothetical protein
MSGASWVGVLVAVLVGSGPDEERAAARAVWPVTWTSAVSGCRGFEFEELDEDAHAFEFTIGNAF